MEYWVKVLSENPDFSLLSEEDCKTIGWVDVEKLAESKVETFLVKIKDISKRWFWKKGFEVGFKTAQSLDNKMFSLEDIENVIELTLSLVGTHWSDIRFELDKDRFKSIRNGINNHIQSLQQTSWDVEVGENNQITKIL